MRCTCRWLAALDADEDDSSVLIPLTITDVDPRGGPKEFWLFDDDQGYEIYLDRTELSGNKGFGAHDLRAASAAPRFRGRREQERQAQAAHAVLWAGGAAEAAAEGAAEGAAKVALAAAAATTAAAAAAAALTLSAACSPLVHRGVEVVFDEPNVRSFWIEEVGRIEEHCHWASWGNSGLVS